MNGWGKGGMSRSGVTRHSKEQYGKPGDLQWETKK